jgi:alcohol dehydrogenase (cytochrome c)
VNRITLLIAGAALTAAAVYSQPPMPTDSWPTYNGDFSGRRFSPLTKINTSNVKGLSLAWEYRILNTGGANPKGTPLMQDGIIYQSSTDNAFALDARTGHELWHYTWPSKGARHFSNRGMGMSGNTVYFETPDCNLVALNKENGQLRWSKSFADIDDFYYCSTAPVVVGNHVMIGVSGDDMDIPGFIDARDPETGDLQWRFYTVPQKEGDPGLSSWPNLDMAKHGGGMTWQPVTYDPDLKLIYVTTGNPQPVIANANRPGDDLYTASIVAVHEDTGKMAWAFQISPHDTHDWDATECPVLFDGTINGQPHKLLAIAARNGKFVVLDRETGKNYVSTDFIHTNWQLGTKPNGQPIPNPEKSPSVEGVLVTPNQGGATNWYPSTFDPQTGLFYVSSNQAYSIYYLYDATENPQGWGGNDRGGFSTSALKAIDYQTGKIKWTHEWESGNATGLLSTAGGLIFTGAPGNALVALDAKTGDPLWHARMLSGVGSPPSTWELDGTQYVIVGAADTIYAFSLQTK